jgi:hypothetical protein
MPVFLFHLQTWFSLLEDLGSIMCVLYRVSSQDTGKTMVDAALGEIISTCERIT